MQADKAVEKVPGNGVVGYGHLRIPMSAFDIKRCGRAGGKTKPSRESPMGVASPKKWPCPPPSGPTLLLTGYNLTTDNRWVRWSDAPTRLLEDTFPGSHP